MTFRLFRRREPKPYGWVDPEKAFIVHSIERPWPVRGGPRRSPEEYDAMRERTLRLRRQYGRESSE